MSNKSDFLAYPEKFHNIESVMRLSSVKRWHMIDTHRTQTLAEHSANVALLVYTIIITAPVGWFSDAHYSAVVALTHDIAESFTGDIPSHTKRNMDRSAIDDLEDKVTPVSFKFAIDENTKQLIKLCDLADGIRFIRLHGVDMTARHAQMGLEDQVRNKINEIHSTSKCK
jgi:hypothetical protein